jgi:hypothetical protein
VNPVAAELLAALERYVDQRVDERLAARGQLDPAREYVSVGPRPPGTSRRAFNATARAMLGAGVAGVRREGRGRRDRAYFVTVNAWHAWRTSARTEKRTAESSDEDLATAALEGAGLRVVHGGRRG